MTNREDKGLLHYAKRAFTYHWNLLIFGGAIVAAAISGVPDIVLPVVLAGEIGYLGYMAGNPKFRKAIDAQDHKALEESSVTTPRVDPVRMMMNKLDRDNRYRFTNLRDRCTQMRQLAAGVRGHAGNGDAMHTEALDRMLWTFLRLLASQQALAEFMRVSDPDEMQRRVMELEGRITEAKDSGNDKIYRSLVDSLATANMRLDNYHKAVHNAEFVEIELDRIEDKVQVLVEMAVGHEDPDYISSQVDSVAASIDDTEAAMREMSFPGVEEFEAAPPAILTATA